ncbi:MAG: tetratricopeptide repeat protein, partial [Acidobacteriaceae bacterium]|nr:tetratricopeptide repeat protein [Acidobacteriaceae bacterium]
MTIGWRWTALLGVAVAVLRGQAPAGASLQAATPVHLVSFRSSTASAADLADFATTFVELRLKNVHEVSVTRGGTSECDVSGSERQTRAEPETGEVGSAGSTPDGASVFARVSGLLSKDPDKANVYTVTYAVRKFDHCQQVDSAQGTKHFAMDEALTALSSIAEEIALHVADFASRKVPVRLASTDGELRSDLEIAFGESPIFKVSREAATYEVEGKRSGARPRFEFSVVQDGKLIAKEFAPGPNSSVRASAAYTQAADFALNLVTDIEARRSVGVSGDYRTIPVQELIGKAKIAACETPASVSSGQICGANPLAVVALIRGRVSEMPEGAYELLGNAYLKLERPRFAAVAFDGARERSAADMESSRRLLRKAANAWLSAGQAETALARLQEIARLEAAAGQQTAETAVDLAHATTAAGRNSEAASLLLAAHLRFPANKAVLDEWEQLLTSLNTSDLHQACDNSRRQAKADAFTGLCVYTLARVDQQSSKRETAVQEYREAKPVLEKTMPNSLELANFLYDFADTLDWAQQRQEALDYAERARDLRRQLIGENSPRTGDSYYQVGLLLSRGYKYQQSEEELAHALSIRLAEGDALPIANTKFALGGVREHTKPFTAADQYKDAIALYEDLNDQWNLAQAYLSLGRFFDYYTNEFREAETYERRAL